MGFVSIGDGFLGHEHYLNQANMNDDKLLDPAFLDNATAIISALELLIPAATGRSLSKARSTPRLA